MKLEKYLANYLEHELINGTDYHIAELTRVIKEALDAFESTENVDIVINPHISDEADICDICKKCGTNNCGNDTLNHACFEGM